MEWRVATTMVPGREWQYACSNGRNSRFSNNPSAGQRQCLLHFLNGTWGMLTKLLDFRFGIWDPELRQEYRHVYKRTPSFARLQPRNTNRAEIYTLRVNVVNRETEYHKDAKDWKGGLTGLVQLGEYEGIAYECHSTIELSDI